MRKPPPRALPTLPLLAWASCSLLTASLFGCGDDETTSPTSSCFELADGTCVEETFASPPVLEPDEGGVHQLVFGPAEIEIDGQRHCVRAYNGMYPGPTIETPASADGRPRQVRVDLRNVFTKSATRLVSDDAEAVCTCTDAETGEACTPGEHDHHGGSCTCTNADGGMCHHYDFNLTNLHFHGSHVRPDYATGGGCVEHDGLACRACTGDRDGGAKECFHADDVLAQAAPSTGLQHRYDVDEDGTHHAGLSWYHPHIHGSTAIQVASGAAGAWIVRGQLDEIPGIAKARERILVLSTPPTTYEPLAEGEPCDEDHLTFDDFPRLNQIPLGDNPQANLVNGVRKPRMIMPPGQIERWRIVDASHIDEGQIAIFRGKDSSCEQVDLAAGPIPLVQIGRDGLTLPRPDDGADWPFAPPYMFLSSGYRIDALLDGSQLAHGDTLCVMSARALQEDTTGTTNEPTGTLAPPTLEAILEKLANGEVVAIVNVTDAAGPPTETNMPDLAQVAADAPSMALQGGSVDALERCREVQAIDSLDEVDQLSALWLLFYNTEGLDRCGFGDHNINAKTFSTTDRARYPYDRVLEKGAVDHWRLVSGFDGHPFHIHINPYLVCPLPPAGSSDPSAVGRLFEPPFAHWRDTYLVNLARTVDVLTEYRAFTGDYVYHCHKLTHEDHGMMELVRVCDPASEDCDTLCDGQRCGWDACASGDEECERERIATRCLVDPDGGDCPEAALRCAPCGEDGACPTGARCDDEPSRDEVLRCIPGCEQPSDCAFTETCEAGSCVPAACDAPCPPPQMCVHGACE